MSKKIRVSASPSEESERTFTFSVEDLGFTDEEWDAADENTKNTAIQIGLDTLPEQPYWALNNWRDKK